MALAVATVVMARIRTTHPAAEGLVLGRDGHDRGVDAVGAGEKEQTMISTSVFPVLGSLSLFSLFSGPSRVVVLFSVFSGPCLCCLCSRVVVSIVSILGLLSMLSLFLGLCFLCFPGRPKETCLSGSFSIKPK
jgi:hypothetical protein